MQNAAVLAPSWTPLVLSPLPPRLCYLHGRQCRQHIFPVVLIKLCEEDIKPDVHQGSANIVQENLTLHECACDILQQTQCLPILHILARRSMRRSTCCIVYHCTG